jgi:hypothetical protein
MGSRSICLTMLLLVSVVAGAYGQSTSTKNSDLWQVKSFNQAVIVVTHAGLTYKAKCVAEWVDAKVIPGCHLTVQFFNKDVRTSPPVDPNASSSAKSDRTGYFVKDDSRLFPNGGGGLTLCHYDNGRLEWVDSFEILSVNTDARQ